MLTRLLLIFLALSSTAGAQVRLAYEMASNTQLAPLYLDPTGPKPLYLPPPQAASVRAAAGATFQFEFLPAGATLFGKTCQTFPTQARNVFIRAGQIWGSLIQSPVPIKVRACWFRGSGTLLGAAGPQTFVKGGSLGNFWHPIALANAKAGRDLNGSNPEILAIFNSNFSWYFGTDGRVPSGQMDFLSVVLHEFGHGLGFLGFARVSGSSGALKNQGAYAIFDTFLEDGAGRRLTTYPDPSSQLKTAFTSQNLWFDGSAARAANGGRRVKLYAPAVWQQGSSVNHLDETTYNGTANALMTPFLARQEAIHHPGPVTLGIFKDNGWPLVAAPTKPVPISPKGNISTTRPTYTFTGVSGATRYRLYVWDDTARRRVIDMTFSPASAGCATGTTCRFTPTTTLTVGHSYRWWVNALVAGRWVGWGGPLAFKVVSGTGGKPVPISPKGNISTTRPTYTFTGVSGATRYRLYVWDDTARRRVIDMTFSPASAGCATGTTCRFTPTTTLTVGHSYRWWVNAFVGGRWVGWGGPLAFKVVSGTGKPGQPVLISPQGTVSGTTQVFRWRAASGATWHYIAVFDQKQRAVFKGWRSAGTTCSGGLCSVTLSGLARGETYSWWVIGWNPSGYGPWSAGLVFTIR